MMTTIFFAILTTIFCVFAFLFGRLASDSERRDLVRKLLDELDDKDKDFDIKIKAIIKFNY